MKQRLCVAGAMAAVMVVGLPFARAWNYEGHRMVAAAAIDSLPEDFPAFARSPAARERVQFLSGEPDRWRILRDPALRHINEPDHYCDLESIAEYNLKPETLPELRNELLGKIYVDRALHPEKFAVEEKADDAKVYLLFGLLPYSIHEYYLTLKAEFAYLREMKLNGATPEDISQAEQNIIYTMGVMSHFAGDGAQPLHLTEHHHGWVGDNPNGYTSSRKIHSWIDGGFMAAAQITYDGIKPHVRPASLVWADALEAGEKSAFPIIIDYLVETHRRVEPLYRLEKDGKFDEEKPSPEGCMFIEDQLLRGGQFLGSLYYSAYISAESVVVFQRPAAPVIRLLPTTNTVKIIPFAAL